MPSPDAPSRSNLPSLQDIIDKTGLGFAQVRFILSGGGVWFADGSELLLISAVTSSVAAEWNLDPMQRGSMVTVVYIGVLFGNLISGPMGDRYGRRHLILASYIGIFVFSMLSSFMMTFSMLCLWRFFVGLSFGLGQPPVNVLACEITPAKWRIVSQSLSSALFSIGEVYSAILLMLDDPTLQHLNWRRLLQLGSIPAVVFWVLASFFLQQSPFYLAETGQHQEAKEVLESMRRDNCLPIGSVQFATPSVEVEAEDEGLDMRSQWREICRGPLLLTTAIMSFTCFAVNLVYYGTLYAYPNVLPILEATTTGTGTILLSTSSAVQLMAGALWELPGTALSIFFGLYMRRKPSLKLAILITVVALLLFVGGAAGPFGTVGWHIGYYVSKCMICVAFGVAYLYVAEVYPTKVRTTGCSVNIAFGRLGATISPLVFEQLQKMTGSYAAFFYVIAGALFSSLLLVDFLPIETYNTALANSIGELEKNKEYGATENILRSTSGSPNVSVP